MLTTGWAQTYFIFGQGLGGSALIATVPMLVLIVLLAALRKPAWVAALSGLIAAIALAAFGYHMPPVLMVNSLAYGACFGIFPISWIVFGALLLYEVTVRTGKFEIIKESIGTITSDRRLQSLLVTFAFGAFLEGCAGFGAPVAVTTAMMVGLGFSSFYASSICLLANTAPVAFGSIGIPVITLAGITALPLDKLSGSVGRICAPFSFCLPAYLILVTSGWRATLEVWPAVLVSGLSFALVQFLVSNFIGPQLTDILSAIAAMGSLILLLRLWTPRSTSHHHHETTTVSTAAIGTQQSLGPRFTRREIWLAWMPYGLLIFFVLAWGYKPILDLLNKASIPFPWPGLHNLVLRMPPVVVSPAKYAAIFNFNWLSAAGTSCVFAAIFSALFTRMSLREFLNIVKATSIKLIRPTATVTSMLAMAFVMNYSGATGTLGLAFAATGSLFPFFSPLMGWLGVFLTGSDTSANALFGNLQVVTANRLGFDPVLIAAANSTGGVMGKMISLQTIAVAAAAANISVEDQSKLFRFTLRHSIFLAVLVGFEVLLYAHFNI